MRRLKNGKGILLGMPLESQASTSLVSWHRVSLVCVSVVWTVRFSIRFVPVRLAAWVVDEIGRSIGQGVRGHLLT